MENERSTWIMYGVDWDDPEQVTLAYCEDPMESGKRIAMHLRDIYPIASAAQIKKLIGTKVGDIIEKKKTTKKYHRKGRIPTESIKSTET